MQPLASQSSHTPAQSVEVLSTAPQATANGFATKAPANDNEAAWKPSLLVLRRRRLSRRANRS
ncbi:MAG: hypothetical protein WA989_15610 [Henriciella sp.]|uniref:hypothetical protein n=1 Tax=Henriciella sp. TaxID=1968823 RepID=UPI003C76EB3D